MNELEFTDYQVETLVKLHPGKSMYDLLKIAQSEMSKFAWNHDKIRHSINRLEKRGKVRSKYEINGGRSRRIIFHFRTV